MSPLSASDILRVWELGQGQHPVERALIFLTFAFPERARDELAALSIGQRDACLLALYQRTFGATFDGFAPCPQCAERLEFSVRAADLLGASPAVQEEQEQKLETPELTVHFRLLNSWDLAAVVGCEEAAIARRLLVERCVLHAVVDGVVTPPNELSERVIANLAQCMADRDPQAELLLNLHCPTCSHQWTVLFDIESFLWTKICAEAKRLLREVHMLAQAYGWREFDILSLSAARRQAYLEMVS